MNPTKRVTVFKRWLCHAKNHVHTTATAAARCRYGRKKPVFELAEKIDWLCSDEERRHTSFEIAERCMEERAAFQMRQSDQAKKHEKWKITTHRCAEKKTLKETGAKFGKGPERVRQIEAQCFQQMRDCIERIARDLTAIIKTEVEPDSVCFYGARVR